IGYSYSLTDNSVAANPTDSFAVIVTDANGDAASATLTISVIDDVPTARADTDALAAGGFGPETGNVLTGAGTTSGAAGVDTPGADGAALTGIRAGTTGNFATVGTGASTIAGQYGTLTISANGNYSYVRNPGSPGGVNDVFGYQITDGDGDTSATTLTISIPDSPVTLTFVPTTGDGTVVAEAGLPARPGESPGSDQQSNSETTAGIITYTAPDGPATVAINGVTVTGAGQVIGTPTGALTVTSVAPGQIGYSFTLADNTQGDNSSQSFTITVTDADGDVATAPLVIRIIDDVPTARDDSASAQEDKPVVINVVANDTPGADSLDVAGKVALGTPPAKGTAVYNGDGTFTYTPTPGQEGSDSFTYTITDGDGDVSTATVRITLAADSTPTIVAGDSSVNEAALPFGSNPGSNAETTTGTLVFSGGADSLASLTIDGVNVTNGGTVTGSYGTLTVTLSGGAYTYSYTLADNTSGDDTAENFAVVAVDSDGDVANDTLTIDIIDDVPTARDDTDSLPAASTQPETGNVITGAGTTSGATGADTPGADGAQVTGVSHGANSVAAGTAIAGDHGTLTLNADGSYSYVRTPGTPSGVTEVFTYTLTDGDGDVSTATLTLSIGDSTPSVNIPAPGGATTTVYEAALAARGAEPQGTGEEAAPGANGDTREAVSGTITFSSPDGIGTLSLGGTVLTPGNLPQTVASNATGTLVVTGFSYDPVSGAGSIAYTYTLADNTLTDPSNASFALVLTDGDGDSAPAGNLVITIVDDAPIARPDVDSVSEDGPLVADGNVLTGVGGGTADSQGADGAGVVAVAFGANQGTLGNPLAGAYGDLVLTSAGTYTYTLDPSNPAVQTLAPGETLTEVFTYTLRDGDGDPAVTTLTIIINGADDGVTINGLDGAGAEEVVNEDDLFDGSSPDAAALTQTGTFS
ncbi:MAG TPA: Ig-like domain-containing protein, partial [Myxococcota bacterium]